MGGVGGKKGKGSKFTSRGSKGNCISENLKVGSRGRGSSERAC